MHILAPSIENAGLNPIAVNHVLQVDILVSVGQRFQGADIPVMKGYFLSITAKFVANH